MKHFRRSAALVLTLSLVFTLLLPAAQARETEFFSEFPDPVPAQAQDWEPADTAELDRILESLSAALKKQGNEEEVLYLCAELTMTYQLMYNSYTFCMLDYYRDPTSCAEDYVKWNAAINQAYNSWLSGYQEVLNNSEYGPVLTRELGVREAVSLLAVKPDTPEQLALLERESELVDAYWTAVTQVYETELGGRTWTEASLQEDESLSEEEALAAELAIAQARNEAAAAIFAELVALRNEYALSKGYDNYADYAYAEVYGRDYTPEDAAVLFEAVKAEIVPLERDLAVPGFYNTALSAALLTGLEDQTQDEMLDAVEPYVGEISSEYAAVFDYMRENNLCDIGPLETKLDVGFTTELPVFSSAYLFNAPYGNYYDVKTLIHEFGHYAHFCLNFSGASRCYDVSEIHSQGLEALFLAFADDLAGEAGGDAYRAAVVGELVYAITDGCLYDEFQQAVYADGDMTVSEMNRLFRSLSEEYGYVYGADSDEAYNWVQVSHTFESPFYYISYATSALTALEILTRAAENFPAAADAYLALAAQTNVEGYRAAVEAAGFSDVFLEGAVTAIAGDLRDYANREIYDLPAFSDLEGHWAADDAYLCAACGLFQGDQAGNFLPDGPMTRAALVTTLWRLAGTPEAPARTDFADIAAGAWYETAVNWAASSGVASGTGSGFDPDAPMTREQFAAMLYRFAGTPSLAEGSSTVLDAYVDSSEVSQWAADAVAWAVEEGVLTGKPGERLDPSGAASRAEAAVMLARCLAE